MPDANTVLYVEVQGPKNHQGLRPIKTVTLSPSISNGIVVLDDDEPRLTTRGRKAGFRMLTELRAKRDGTMTPVDDAAEASLVAWKTRTNLNRQVEARERAVKHATKVGEQKPPESDELKAAKADAKVIADAKADADAKVIAKPAAKATK